MFVCLCNEIKIKCSTPEVFIHDAFASHGLVYIAACPWVSNGNAKQRIPTAIHRAALA